MKKLNSSGFAHTILLVAFVGIFAISGVAYLVASHADSVCSSTSTQTVNGVTYTPTTSTDCSNSNCSTTTTVNGVTSQSSDCGSVPKVTIPKIPTPVIPKVPTPTAPSPTPTPTPTPPTGQTGTINNPTAATCKPYGKRFTVYASVPTGTPAYSYSYFGASSHIIRTVPYKTAIDNVFCGTTGVQLYHYDGQGTYSVYHLQDVSTTQP